MSEMVLLASKDSSKVVTVACPLCGRISRQILKDEYKNSSIAAFRSPHTCPVCGTTFASSSSAESAKYSGSYARYISQGEQSYNADIKTAYTTTQNSNVHGQNSIPTTSERRLAQQVNSTAEKFMICRVAFPGSERSYSYISNDLTNDCPADLKNEVLSAVAALSRITTKERLSTFQAVTIQPLLNKIDTARVRALEEKSELEELQSRYVVLCSVAGVQPEAFSSEGGILEKLRNKVATLEKQVVMQTEQEYISDCVNEVMSEMGYDIIGNRSVTKRSGKRFRNELFSYGDGTAINVTYDSEGQIAMELGGIDRADRIPTSDEANVLREGMESFCSDFRDFEELLKAKGVLIKSRISMAPPTAEYATIINVSDYTITTSKPISEIAVKETRSKAATKRTMQKEDN
ncbi:hypothetical protein SDC9_59831 [bioreactor metagenome]|uniref:Uncharacterized protein n=1 Tax=bioreactor metagenome TaxID=1076179 RepID=A0A644XH74_9ZZZZ